ncbi:MAG: FAD-dependent monooxygenase [Pseudomonadota bacterium]
MTKRRAVVLGAGVAGLSAAWWLTRIGWAVTVLESASQFRDGGHMLGLSGPGLESCRQMGIVPALEAGACDINENVYRDRRGRELMRLRYRDVMEGLPFVVLQRGHLVRTLYNAVVDDVDIQFDAQVDRIETNDDLATAGLSDGQSFEADLLIGADGFRSFTRQQVFGADDQFLAPLGYRFAAYELDEDLGLGSDFLSFSEPGLMSEYYALPESGLAALHIWRSSETGSIPADERWPLVEQVTSATHEMVQSMVARAKHLTVPLIDDMTLVDMPRWSRGRTLLIGDAAHCLTLVSGQGAGISIASAAILAKELKHSELSRAMECHAKRLRPAIERLQRRSRNMAKMFIPSTSFGFHVRNTVLRNMPRRWLGRYFMNAVKSEILAISDFAQQ